MPCARRYAPRRADSDSRVPNPHSPQASAQRASRVWNSDGCSIEVRSAAFQSLPLDRSAAVSKERARQPQLGLRVLTVELPRARAIKEMMQRQAVELLA